MTQEGGRTLDFAVVGGIDVAELDVDRLRLHLAGDLMTTMPLLLGALERIELVSADGVHRLAPRQLVQAGFAEDEALLRRPGNGQPAYGLLQEHFAFRRKFQFFDLEGLRGRLGQGAGFALRLVFRHGAPVLATLRAEHVRLNCVPVLYLFPLIGAAPGQTARIAPALPE